MLLAAGIIGICGLVILNFQYLKWKEKQMRFWDNLEFCLLGAPVILGWLGYANCQNTIILVASILVSIRFGYFIFDNYSTILTPNARDIANLLGALMVGIELTYSILFIISNYIH